MRCRKRQTRFTHVLTSRRIACEFEGRSQPPRHIVNAQRRAVYEDRARAQGATADATGRIYAAEIIRLAPPGTWFLSEAAVWTQK